MEDETKISQIFAMEVELQREFALDREARETQTQLRDSILEANKRLLPFAGNFI